MDGNSSLGRHLSRSFTTGLSFSSNNQDRDDYGRSDSNSNGMFSMKPSNVRVSFHVRLVMTGFFSFDEASLKEIFSCLQLKASLSRAFGRKIKQDRAAASAATAAASSISTNGNMVTDDCNPLVNNSPEIAPPSASSSSIHSEARDWTLKNSQADKHRRVKSSGDIDNITVTRV